MYPLLMLKLLGVSVLSDNANNRFEIFEPIKLFGVDRLVNFDEDWFSSRRSQWKIMNKSKYLLVGHQKNWEKYAILYFRHRQLHYYCGFVPPENANKSNVNLTEMNLNLSLKCQVLNVNGSQIRNIPDIYKR